MSEYLDKTGLSYFWGKIKPKFYNMEFNNGGIVTPNGFLSNGITVDLGVSKTTFEKGLYVITYDVFVFSTQESNSTGEVFLVADDGTAQVNASSSHKIVAPMFGDLAFGIFVSYTDFIELSKPCKVKIKAGNGSGNGVTFCLGSNTTGDDFQPTVIKLR